MSNDKEHKNAEKIGTSFQMAWERVADYLDRHFNGLSITARKMILLVFGLSVGTICVLSITGSIWNNNDNVYFPADQITIPKDIRTPENTKPALVEEYMRILEYKQFLDSLKIYDKIRYDSIIALHPGLIDNLIRMLNEMKHRHIDTPTH